jgi:hypothetical protein
MALDDFKSEMAALKVDDALCLLAEQTLTMPRSSQPKHVRVHDAINRFFWGVLCFLIFTVARSILLALAH